MNVVYILLIVIIVIGGGFLFYQNSTAKQNKTPSMMSGMEHKGQDSEHTLVIKDDKTFLQEMIPHHEEAIASSKEILQISESKEVQTLAEGIIKSQENEVISMKEWYASWFSEPYKATGNYKAMMRSLSGIAPKDAEQQYLAEMLLHHNGAIVMAEKIKPITRRQEIKDLSQSIIKTQKEEVSTIQSLITAKDLPANSQH